MELEDEDFRVLVESVQDYAIYFLGPDGTIRSWNAGARRLKQYQAEEIIGQSFARFFTPEDRATGKPAQLLRTASATGRIEDVGWRVRKDGSQFWASAVITRLRDRAGHDLGFAKVTRDLTDRSYRAFVEASHAIVWTTDAAGRPNADSPTWRAFTGQTDEAWRGEAAWDVIHPDDVAAMRARWAEARGAAAPFRTEARLRRRDGAYVWMEMSAVPLLDGDGGVREWFGVSLDISTRKRLELEREAALELWTTTLRSIGDGVIATDRHGNVRFLNPVAEELTGWTTAAAAGRSLHEVFSIFNEDTGEPVENPVDKVLRLGAVVGLANHTFLRKRNGATTPIDDSAAPIHDRSGAIDGVVLVFRDASEAKREVQRRTFLATAVEQLVGADDYREALARIATLAVPRLADWAAVDIVESGQPRQIAVAHADPEKVAFARELGRRYPADPSAPSGVPNVLRTGRSEFYPEIPRDLLEATAVDAEHLRIIRELDLRSAMVVPLRGKLSILGAITFVFAGSERRYTPRDLALAEDLAARAALIIERRRLEEEAAHANRMKDEFLATMSHELRTPLQAILGYAAVLLRGKSRDPTKAIEAIARNATAQARLVDDILDVARITSGKLRLSMGQVPVASVIRAALDVVRPAAEARGLRIVEDLPDDLGAVLGDDERLQQIVWNLLSNAIKFTDPDGTIEIGARPLGSSLELRVRDTGRGIPREHLATIFERFLQLDPSTTRQRGGLGLGLAIVRHLVQAHGGTVRAESDGPGTGATFIVTLPRARADEAAPASPPPSPREQPLRGLRVLVVEDDEDARVLVADVLSDAGAVVATAGSAREGFDLLRAEPPHVLVSDIAMPDEDGYALVRRVRGLPAEHGGDVPAIAMTAYARSEDARAAIDAGFQLHLVKPLDPDRLVEAIAAWAPRRLPRGPDR